MNYPKCIICGSDMVWQNDFMLMDYGIDGEGNISVWDCSNWECETSAEFTTFYTEQGE